MSIALFLKNNLKHIPPSVGQLINRLPYDKRPGIGSIYSKRKLELRSIRSSSDTEKQDFVFKRMKHLVTYSYQNILFYKKFYDGRGFKPDMLISFADIKKIPIVTKSILNEFNIDARSAFIKGRYVVNTGGSSGTPFGFYIEPSSIGHEWAHMHVIWETLEYKPSDLKLVFNGRSDLKDVVEYDAVRNHFAIDIYADYKVIAEKLKTILKKYKINYLHGYPSSIYDFSIFCKFEDPELRELLSKNLKGAFLGSEYPHKYYRDFIEEVFNIKTISWYGHTERSILAYEKKSHFIYEPFLSYGFTEVQLEDDNNYSLIGTSYYNFASPLIRYNTEDLVSDPEVKNGIVESFKIVKGREGEFVSDKFGKKINLTGLIFGRHHLIFNHSKFIQVKQISDGHIEIHYVSQDISPKDAVKLFDMNNLNFKVDFIQKKMPTRTISGKINLLIK